MILTARKPCRVDNCGQLGVSESFVRDEGIRDLLPGLQLPVSELECFIF